MTAIALLNSENDPHVVADTLLSADGADPNKDKSIWLPALGYIHSEWENEDGKWHIPRLGRKTFAVPVSSGILAFAGHCQSAFNFGMSYRLISIADNFMIQIIALLKTALKIF